MAHQRSEVDLDSLKNPEGARESPRLAAVLNPWTAFLQARPDCRGASFHFWMFFPESVRLSCSRLMLERVANARKRHRTNIQDGLPPNEEPHQSCCHAIIVPLSFLSFYLFFLFYTTASSLVLIRWERLLVEAAGSYSHLAAKRDRGWEGEKEALKRNDRKSNRHCSPR